jgi:hypothetical protein
VIVDISSNSAYSLPSFIIPKKAYPLAETDEAKFSGKGPQAGQPRQDGL